MATIMKLKADRAGRSVIATANLLESDIKAELVAEEQYGSNCVMLCFEKYYLRNNSTAGLSILVTGSEISQDAVVVSFAGGSGPLNLDYGSDSAFADNIAEIMKGYGFKVLSVADD